MPGRVDIARSWSTESGKSSGVQYLFGMKTMLGRVKWKSRMKFNTFPSIINKVSTDWLSIVYATQNCQIHSVESRNLSLCRRGLWKYVFSHTVIVWYVACQINISENSNFQNSQNCWEQTWFRNNLPQLNPAQCNIYGNVQWHGVHNCVLIRILPRHIQPP